MEWLNAVELLDMVGRRVRSLLGFGPPDQKPISRAADISLAVFTLVVLERPSPICSVAAYCVRI